MARNNQRSTKNNNPEGRNQFSSGWRDTAKERPLASAAAAAAAVGAGVFLWSRRNQISEQISNLSEQFSDWTSSQQYSEIESPEMEFAGSDTTGTSSKGSSGKGSRGKNNGQGFSSSTGTATGSGTSSGASSF